MAEMLTLSDFSPLVGETFQLNFEDSEHTELKLIEAEELPARGNPTERKPFSLMFRAARDCGLWQGIMKMKHESTGAIELFMVPIGEDDEGMYFQALFN